MMNYIDSRILKNLGKIQSRVSIRSSCFDYIAILRPDILILTWTCVLFGFYKGATTLQNTTISNSLVDKIIFDYHPDILLFLIAYGCLSGAVYILNQIMDINSDRVNGKGLMLAVNRISVQSAYLEVVILSVIGLSIILILFSKELLYIAIISVFLGLAYSLRPIRLKGRPIFDLLSNALGYGLIAIAAGWAVVTPLQWWYIIKYTLPYISVYGAIYVVSALTDVRGDKISGDITTAVVLGRSTSLTLAVSLSLLTLLLATLNGDISAVLIGVLCFLFFLYARIFQTDKSVKFSYRTSGFFVAFIMLLPQPIALVILLTVFGIWRWLYNDFIH